MTVSAHPVNDLLVAANESVGFVDMRAATPVLAGTYLYEGANLITGWHHHDLHQIEYAVGGIAHVETAQCRYLVPPQHAVWIPAGLSHRTTLIDVTSIAVFFDPALVDVNLDTRAHVVSATPVLREMMTYAARWPINRAASDATADAFFVALALLAQEWIDIDVPLWLPTATDPIVRTAMDHTQAHLADATIESIANAVAVSERTLRRHFLASTGMTWRTYLATSRLMRAVALLAEADATVLDVAIEIGYDSASAFTRAFHRATGENPSAYRQRVLPRL